ncbi:sugar transferase [Nocardioides sp. R1-1]|uniref:sugar transferase n=1 Tax=Nocardioides sp. R1-1 TaxID=3383502 RepID=UPI0038CF9133
MTGEWSYRLRDIVLGGLLLVAVLPVLAVVAVVVLLTDGRPLLFRQERPGRFGQPFTLVKVRTMRAASGPTEDDEQRISRVGRFLRATSLDELPELWNVVRGDMSLVGPRPLLDDYLGAYTGVQHLRHQVRPGLTGLAQVSGRNALDWQAKLDLDVHYVRERSHALDLRILARTLVTVLGRDGVSHPGHATMPRLDARPD